MKYLRSPYDSIHGLVYFLRMVEKIRIHAQGKLAEDYVPNLGKGFDLRCCSFLGVNYDEFAAAVKTGLSDEQAWNWVMERGLVPSDEQIEIWNAFMTKRGWRDDASPTLERRKKEAGLESRNDIQTMFDFIDIDEGRSLHSVKPI